MDKLKHFAACLVITLTAGYFWHPAAGVVLALTAGTAKELRGSRFDWWDMAANVAGILAALVILP